MTGECVRKPSVDASIAPFVAAACSELLAAMTQRVTTRSDVADRLREHQEVIRALGVERLALFGSLARNQATPTSDVDLLVEFEPGQKKNHDAWIELAELLESTLHGRVDLVTLEGLSPHLGPHILAEAVDVLRAA